MKREELIESNFIKMKEEYLSSYNNSCRKIDAIFSSELKRFKDYLSNFNASYNCIEEREFNLINSNLNEIFISFKVMLIDNYKNKFNLNLELLTNTMNNFFIKRLANKQVKMPSKELSKYLNNMCMFDFFKVSNDLEDKLMNFYDDLVYKYVNSDEARENMESQIRNINYTIICELKKVISASIEDKQDILRRYNTLNKEVLMIEPTTNEKKR